MRLLRPRGWLGAVIVWVLAGCSGVGGATTQAGEARGEVVVSAAASLTDTFGELARMVEAANPDLDVTLNLAGSQTLAAQILQGAPVDVFASANQAQMDVVLGEGLADRAVPFATNDLTIAVAPGNPEGVRGLEDLADPGVVVVLAAPDVPAGAAAAEVLDRAGVVVTPASLEPDVRAALSKVELGEADAAVVYTSDIATSDTTGRDGSADDIRGGVEAVEIPAAQNITVTYPVAVLVDAPNRAGAQAFVDVVLSEAGRRVLSDNGFGDTR